MLVITNYIQITLNLSLMFIFIYKLYFLKLKSRYLDRLYVRIIVRVINILMPLYFRLSAPFYNLRKKSFVKDDDLFIVSLTSFPARINKVWLSIETIFHQKVKPDRIILWLFKDEFSGIPSLPKELLTLERRGLEIRFCDKNLMPHKKYFYTMQEFPNANVITVDDDMLYPPNLIEKLIKYHNQYPDSIICTITRQIKAERSTILPYREWSYKKTNSKPDSRNLTMGGGGTLFPPYSLDMNVFDIEALKNFALKADDLWLKIMSLKKQTKVVSIAGEYPRLYIPIIQKQNVRLMDSNIGAGQNDKIFENLMKHYQIPISIFEK